MNKYDAGLEGQLFTELDPKLRSVCRLILNTGLRPPKEIKLAEKGHVNLNGKSRHYRFSERDGYHLVGQDMIIPPRSILVVHGKNKTTRLVPLNKTAFDILTVLCSDEATGDYLFTNLAGQPIKRFQKGFSGAWIRAAIKNLRSYDLRGTFATRLAERYVPADPIISSLLGHVRSSEGFGHSSRITRGYTQATWEAMVRAVESLEYPPEEITVFGMQSDKSRTNGLVLELGDARQAIAN